MAVTITVAELRAALRLNDSAEETAEVTRLLAYATEAIEQHAPTATETAMNEAVRRLGGPSRGWPPWYAPSYQQPSPEEVHAQVDRVIDQLGDRFSQAASVLAEAGADILAFTAFPVAHWKQVWSNNPQERLDKEIRRRTDVVGYLSQPAGRAASRRRRPG